MVGGTLQSNYSVRLDWEYVDALYTGRGEVGETLG